MGGSIYNTIILLRKWWCFVAIINVANAYTKHNLPSHLLGTAVVDYTAANEYISAHYGIDNYFGLSYQHSPKEQIQQTFRRREPIYNGRALIQQERHQQSTLSSFDKIGFGVYNISFNHYEIDFTNMTQIENFHLPKICNILQQDIFLSCEIDEIIFWHPMLRMESNHTKNSKRENNKNDSYDGPPKANVASMVHIDTDVNAYGLEGILKLVYNNYIGKVPKYNWSHLQELLQDHSLRFVLINSWYPLCPIVTQSPLGILYIKDFKDCIFPNPIPIGAIANWYVFDHMTNQECLFFKQYDRRLDLPSDFWHCAINIAFSSSPSFCKEYYVRKSFDVKVLVILNETVPTKLDRINYNNNNQKQGNQQLDLLLNLEQSKEFCHEQSLKLGKQGK